MAKDDWRERLESIGKREPDEVSKRIMADIEANKKRNKELSDKRTRDAIESVLNQGSGAADSPAKASSKPKKAGKSSKTSSSVGANRASTTVRAQKGGSMTAETTTKESQNKATVERQVEQAMKDSKSSAEKGSKSGRNTSISQYGMHNPRTYQVSIPKNERSGKAREKINNAVSRVGARVQRYFKDRNERARRKTRERARRQGLLIED